MGRITEDEKALMARWKAGRTPFATDGLVNEEAYLASSPRVVLALKDAYDNNPAGPQDMDLVDYICKDARGQTWATAARWCYGLQRLHEDLAWADVEPIGYEWHPLHRQALQSVGVMNMKKSVSPTAATNPEALRAEGQKDAVFLKEQWALYTPNLTLCAGWQVFGLLRQALGIPEADIASTRRGTRYLRAGDKAFLVEVCHPAAQIAPALKYHFALDAARELLQG